MAECARLAHFEGGPLHGQEMPMFALGDEERPGFGIGDFVVRYRNTGEQHTEEEPGRSPWVVTVFEYEGDDG